MIPYLGEYRYSVDAKGRFNVPAKFREILKQEETSDLVLMKGLDGCVFLLPLSAWNDFRAPLDDDRLRSDREGRFFARDLVRGGDVQQPDSQGRIQLSKDLRAHAKIKDSILIYGNDRVIEAWAPEVFDAYMVAGNHMGPSLEEGASKFLRHGRKRTTREGHDSGPHDG